MKFLLATLYSPLAANGESGAGTYRPSWTRPGRAAALGLVAAALGIDRNDVAGHAALSSGYGYGVRTDAVGGSLIDYHTVTVGKGAAARSAQTRRDELASDVHQSAITHREYRTDALYTIALWARTGSHWALDEIAQALNAPHWVLYLGCRSCPLALPLDPQIVEASSLVEALSQRPAIHPDLMGFLPMPREKSPELACDVDAPGVIPDYTTARRDLYVRPNVLNERPEYVVRLEA